MYANLQLRVENDRLTIKYSYIYINHYLQKYIALKFSYVI